MSTSEREERQCNLKLCDEHKLLGGAKSPWVAHCFVRDVSILMAEQTFAMFEIVRTASDPNFARDVSTLMAEQTFAMFEIVRTASDLMWAPLFARDISGLTLD